MKQRISSLAVLVLVFFTGALFAACTAPASSMTASSAVPSVSVASANSAKPPASQAVSIPTEGEILAALALPEGARIPLTIEELQGLNGSWYSGMDAEQQVYQYRFHESEAVPFLLTHGVWETDIGLAMSGTYTAKEEGVVQAEVHILPEGVGTKSAASSVLPASPTTLQLRVEKVEGIADILVFTLLSFTTDVPQFEEQFKPLLDVPTAYISFGQ